jgi:CxxC motif-containing protein (DUF1111 family)
MLVSFMLFSIALAQPTTQLTPTKGAVRAGGPIAGLSANELLFFQAGLARFTEVETVPDGLGPRFNNNSCAGCHAQPTIGGTSPAVNPQIAVATLNGATNTIPSFISINGPIREARFIKNPEGITDGQVHDLFTITGRTDTPANCSLAQPNFAQQVTNNNIIFRIPTPVFGLGLIEAIPDLAILQNKMANLSAKEALGIAGVENRNPNDGTITKFGWKAQNKSGQIFSGEAYNVEMGITNEQFPNERDNDLDDNPNCFNFNAVPEDHTNFGSTGTDIMSDIVGFSIFMRFLAPPQPLPPTPQTQDGLTQFTNVGCAMCHTPSLQTGVSSSPALNNQTVNLFSDLLLHNMGEGLEDNITQGAAGSQQFRTAPLWGIGQRLFFLHDGRATTLMAAIQAHSSTGSEANKVIANFNALSTTEQGNVIAFLQSI